MQRSRIADKIVSVLLAILIWAYVISGTNPVGTTTVRFIPVQLLNESALQSAGLAIAGTGDYTVDVVIAGTRSELAGIKSGDIIARADLSDLHVGQNYITVEVEAPQNVTVNEVRTQSIQVYVDTAVAEERSVALDVVNVPDGFEISTLFRGAQSVFLTGAKSLVDTVDKVRMTMDASQLKQDEVFSTTLDVEAVGADGSVVPGVSISQEKIDVQAVLYAVKQVALNVPLEGDYDPDVEVVSSIVPTSIVIKGPAENIEDIWTIDSYPIDVSAISESCSIEIQPRLPYGVGTADASAELYARYEVRPRERQESEFPADKIEIVGVEDGMTASLDPDQTLTVLVRGTSAQMQFFDESDVSVWVSAAQLGPGTHEVDPIVSIDGIYGEDMVITCSPETLKLTIEAAPQDDEENASGGALRQPDDGAGQPGAQQP